MMVNKPINIVNVPINKSVAFKFFSSLKNIKRRIIVNGGTGGITPLCIAAVGVEAKVP